jgi:hypothetical protein
MDPSRWLLLVAFALGAYGTGLIWAMELSVFRSWQLIGDPGSFDRVRAAHWRQVPYYVFAPIGVLFIATIALLVHHPPSVAATPLWTSFALQLASHVLTGMTWGRWQARIALEHQHRDSPYLARIVRTHWIRTALVTLNMFALGWAVAELTR